jgi:hypothetical protein
MIMKSEIKKRASHMACSLFLRGMAKKFPSNGKVASIPLNLAGKIRI